MESWSHTRIKVCCMASVDEMWMAVRAGASAVGLVSKMPSGPGPIDDELIAEIAARVPPGIASFLLTPAQDVDVIIDQQRRSGANTLQLVDRVEPRDHRALRSALPGIAIVQVIHVVDESSVDEARELAEGVHALLLDSGNPKLAVKELGGTGRTHDWSLSRRIREAVRVPLYLAGGLNPANVGEAIRAVSPFGVDVCSALRPGGPLNPALLDAFVDGVAAAQAR